MAYGVVMTPVSDLDDLQALVELSGAGEQVLADLDACVQRLHQVHRAKVTLASLDTTTLRGVLAARRARLSGEAAAS